MRILKHILISLTALLTLTACEEVDIAGMLNSTSPQVNERFAKSMEWNNAHGYATLKVPDSYKVYVCVDTHIEEGKDNYLKRFILDHRSDADCPFAIHLGDLINKKNNEKLCAEDLDVKPEGYVEGSDTLFTVTGNHDLYFNQWDAYVQYRHTSTYYVIAETASGYKDLYIFLDSGSGTLGTDQTTWLQELLEASKDKGYRHTIVGTHTNFFQQDQSQSHTSNYALEETYTLTAMFTKYKVDMVLTGHDHYWEDTMYGKVRYLTLDALKDGLSNAAYLILTVDSDLKYEEVKMQ